jgi:hypothetical protein
MEYGRDFDFSRPFFEQFKELQLDVPRLALLNVKGENSDYCNMTFWNRNCYLVFGGDCNEDVMYGTLCMNNKDCLDIDYSNKNELCYYLNDSIGCYGCMWTYDSKNCNDCMFISDCIGCNDCILCTNLVNKSYCIENKQYLKEEYFEKKKELIDGSFQKVAENMKKFKKLRDERIVKNYHGVTCENCTGDYLKNSKNCHNSYDISDSEDLLNIIFAIKGKDLFNSSLIGHKSEVCYNVIANVASSFIKYSNFTVECNNIEYGELNFNSEYLFGCIGLRHKKYCILNKQYSKENFFKLREKIVEHMKKTGEWGQFFPQALCSFAYNEGTSYKYYKLTKEEALAAGFKWKDPDLKEYKAATYDPQDKIDDVADLVTDEMLACEDCKKNYKIVKTELKFYRKIKVPLPHKCPECRHLDRTAFRNPKQLWDRKCEKCDVEIKTTYAPERPENVYCERCYLEEVM